MKIKFLFFILVIACAAATCSAAQSVHSVWAVDFVKTKENHQRDYLQFIEANWARARAFMKQKGIAHSYRALSLPPGQKAEWDVLLMTEYVGQAGYERREAVFKEYQASPARDARPGTDAANRINVGDISTIILSRVFQQPISSETARMMLAAQTADPEAAAARIPLEHYLQGHATGNAEFMRKAFHTEGNLIFIRDGKYTTLSFADYIARQSGKPAPDEDKRKRWIESVDVAGNSAVGKIILDYPSGKFVDYMTLLKINGEWKIVNKSFYFEPKATGGK